MQVLLDDIRTTLGADVVCLPCSAQAKSRENTDDQTALTQIRHCDEHAREHSMKHTMQLNEELQTSREVEVALAGMKLSDVTNKSRRPVMSQHRVAPKDVVNTRCSTVQQSSCGLVDMGMQNQVA